MTYEDKASYDSTPPCTAIVRVQAVTSGYGVATVSRIDKITGLFCRISSLFKGSFSKETYILIDPTKQSQRIEEV